MGAEIKVGVGADVSGLEKGLNQAEKDVKAFGKTVEKLDLDKGISKGANQAGNALVNLGRVAQDAPFGFVAIQNNINPLLESFERLKTETGSTGGALKALAQSMAGPAGLGVAVSVLTAGITYLSQHPETLTNLFSTLTDTTKGLTAAQQAYNDTLAESVSSVQGEVANVNSLVNIAKDETLSRAARLEAIKALNKQYPELNNQITLEGINSKKTTAAINDLNNALVTRAKIQAVQELIGDTFKKQLESQSSALQTQASTMSKVVAFFQLALPGQGAFIANSTLMTSGAEEQNKALTESKQTLSDYQKILDGLNTELAKTGNLFVDVPAKIKKAHEHIKKEKDLKGIFSIQDQVFIKGFKAPELDLSSLQRANDQIENHRREMKARFQLWGKDLGNFGKQASEIISTNISTAFASIGESIGNALANGKDIVGAVGETLLSAIGAVCKQLGEAAIAVGVGMLAIKASFKNPFTAIAAGVALVALGSYISSSVANIPKGGGGGGASTSTFAPSVPSGFSPTAPGGQAAHPSQNVFIPNTILKGTDIVISYNRTTALNGRTG